MAAKKTTKKRAHTRGQADEEITVKGHALKYWNLILLVKNNPWVFVVLGTVWGSLVTGGITIGVKVLAPIVTPIAEKAIDKKAKKYVAYVDSVINLQKLEIDSIKLIITSEISKEKK